MMHDNPFSDAEIARRLSAFRDELSTRKLDGAVVAAPENVFYLTGLDHWGYFAPHLLIVPLRGTPVLVTRAMERVTVANQVRTARFEGHSDSETAAEAAARVLQRLGPRRRIGIESWSSGLPHGLACRLAEAGRSFTAKGADPDTLVASAKAYLGALNKLMSKRTKTASVERRIHSTDAG